VEPKRVSEESRLAAGRKTLPLPLQGTVGFMLLPLPGGKLVKGEADVLERVRIGFHLLDEEPDVFAFPDLVDQGPDEAFNVNSHFSSPCFVLFKARSRNQPSQTTIVEGSDNFRLSK
jgi:hypothetical protein